jgi:hypothetical protein
MERKAKSLLVAFSVLYLLHIGYGVFYYAHVERVEAWLCPLVFLVGVSSHRWIALGNVLIHMVGSLGELKNVLLGAGILKIPVIVTHSLMLAIFLFLYLQSD